MLDQRSVNTFFDDMIRPAIAMDGGYIELVEIKGNDVVVRLGGACIGCPSSAMTLRLGVENALREAFPEMGSLIQVA
jgi:Fe-S cluster biogenesis protein NfuA